MGVYAFIMWCRSDNAWPFTTVVVDDALHGYADIVYVPSN